MHIPLYAALARSFVAYKNCIATNNGDWQIKHAVRITSLIKEFFPHGSGFDAGCKFDFERSNADRLVVYFSYHHMDENGFYSGWSEHTLFINPSLAFGVDLTIRGAGMRENQEYFYDTFNSALATLVSEFGTK